MSTALRLTFDEFQQMVARGAFDSLGGRDVELIFGELRAMTPPGPSLSQVVSRLNRWSTNNTTADEVEVRIQDPIDIPELDSEPQPDVVWARPKDYSDEHPRARDMLLVIEVAGSSLHDDLGERAELFAQAGVKDYWVVNLEAFCIEVFRAPKKGRYTERRTYKMGDKVSPLALPKIQLTVSGLFSGTT
jgi:Uma2 family endonuclease